MTSESPRHVPAPVREWVPRFHIAHLMALPVLLAVVLVWLDRKALLPTYTWSGVRTMALDFEVVDGESGRPLEDVLIQVVEPGGKPVASCRTGPEGRATLVGEFVASGTAGMFGNKNDARILPFRYSLIRAGYCPAQGGNTTGYYLGSSTPHPRYRWGLTPIDSRTEAVGAR
jgi:hypothetical protein